MNDTMQIIDLNGQEITVTDLPLAILQADDYRHLRHLDPAYAEQDARLQAYWEDVYQQLTKLQDAKT